MTVWVVAASVAYFVVLMITFIVNIPLNNELAATARAVKRSAPR
ncbi:anthrone oxygenase family protein [Streptomyces noursei]